MRKYKEIAAITAQYLSGNLDRLTIEYKEKNNLFISILYSDDHNILYDYDIEIDSSNKNFSFLGHQSKSMLHRFSLDRDKQFELALTSYLFSSV
jgi:hypothetical protein